MLHACVGIIYKIMFENVVLMYSVFIITVYMYVVLEDPREDCQCQLGNLFK